MPGKKPPLLLTKDELRDLVNFLSNLDQLAYRGLVVRA